MELLSNWNAILRCPLFCAGGCAPFWVGNRKPDKYQNKVYVDGSGLLCTSEKFFPHHVDYGVSLGRKLLKNLRPA